MALITDGVHHNAWLSKLEPRWGVTVAFNFSFQSFIFFSTPYFLCLITLIPAHRFNIVVPVSEDLYSVNACLYSFKSITPCLSVSENYNVKRNNAVMSQKPLKYCFRFTFAQVDFGIYFSLTFMGELFGKSPVKRNYFGLYFFIFFSVCMYFLFQFRKMSRCS